MKSAFSAFFLCLILANAGIGYAQPYGPGGKDPCLLDSQNCPNQTMTLQEKIVRLQQEIGKGTVIYTPNELRHLEDKLREAQKMEYDILFSPSPGSSGGY